MRPSEFLHRLIMQPHSHRTSQKNTRKRLLSFNCERKNLFFLISSSLHPRLSNHFLLCVLVRCSTLLYGSFLIILRKAFTSIYFKQRHGNFVVLCFCKLFLQFFTILFIFYFRLLLLFAFVAHLVGDLSPLFLLFGLDLSNLEKQFCLWTHSQ